MDERRSFFFPLALIAAGVIWLLISMGYIPSANLWALTRLWPLFLIGAGVGLLLRNSFPYANAVISGLLIVGAMAAVFYAPQLGLDRGPAWHFDFNGGGSVAGSGDIETEERALATFTDIIVNYPAEVTIQQGQEASVSVRADDNLLPQLDTRVAGSQLIIGNSESNWGRRVNPSETVRIVVIVPDPSSIEFNSAGSVKATGLTGESLEISLDGAGNLELSDLDYVKIAIQLDGAGNITASGSVDSLTAELDGLGNLDAGQLTAQSAVVTVDGLGNATVRAVVSLNVAIDGLGSVNYYGSPQLTEDSNGLGSVKRLGN